MTLARRGVTLLLRSAVVGTAVRALARARGHSLVLVYHRLGSPVPHDCEIVPSVPVDLFRAHVQALGEVADVVRLDDLLRPALESWQPREEGSRRPRLALTFDDDLPSHLTEALPALQEARVPAAFFLSGRALHGLRSYWFQQLEMLLVTRGLEETAAAVGSAATNPAALVLACERDPGVRRRVVELAVSAPEASVLQAEEIAQLAAAGMTIGFHTIDHAVLTELDDAALVTAVEHGCGELAAAAGVPLRFFAYPHGKADTRSARAVRSRGFEAAFTGRPESLRAGQDRFAIGRWEPGPIPVDDLLVKLTVYLHRPMPGVRGREVASA